MESFNPYNLMSDPTESKSMFRFYLDTTTGLYVKNYLYNLHLKKINNSEFAVNKVLSLKNNVDPILKLPDINYSDNLGLYLFEDLYLFFSTEYKSEKYELNIQSYLEQDFSQDKTRKISFICINGISSKAELAKELANKILGWSVANSPLRYKAIRFDAFEFQSEVISAINIVETPETPLNNLYLPEIQLNQLKRFVNSIKLFNKNRMSLRFLLNGKPGTGKTQLINAVITETKNIATSLICAGGSLPVKKLVEFCNYFDPCIWIIDDVDFIATDRNLVNMGSNLGEFLQALDGFLPNNVFVLAATNDKKLVDAAASRPGRFDLILDISEIEPEHYLTLIKRETDDPIILKLFDNKAIERLKNKKVTGAFLVSLIKQIRSSVLVNGTISKAEFYQYLNLCYNGFYSTNNDNFNKAVGFGG